MDPKLDNLEQKEQAGYGLEVLCASWTPLATADAEAFLASFYRFQQG